jgi:hypothetical protein
LLNLISFILFSFFLFILFIYFILLFYLFIIFFIINSTNEPIGDKTRSRLPLKRPAAGLVKDGEKCNSEAGRKLTSEEEKSRQVAGYVGGEIAEKPEHQG